jgi:predicted nucleic acid-binding protein
VTASGATVAGSVVSRLEVRSGVRPGEIATVERLFGVIQWAPVTAEIADLAGDYSRQYRRSHSSIGAIDYVVAATVAALGAELWTHNISDFPMFPNLQAPY